MSAAAVSASVRTDVFALVTGGGTGGHVYPALAVAEALVARGHDRAAIRFVGARRGLETTAVPAAGFDLDVLPGRGLRRSLSADALRANAGALAGTARAVPAGVAAPAAGPPPGRARRRRVRVAALRRRRPPAANPHHRPRAERRPRRREPPRRAASARTRRCRCPAPLCAARC